MASCSALIALLVVVSSVAAASAVTFTVGDNSGWTLTGVNYDTWASGKTFAVGDVLVFNFATGSHDVVEVGKSGYDGCSISNALNTIRTGPATVTLNSSGTHYYICGIPGHCSSGMKLAVTVGSGSPSTPPAPGSPPSTPTPTTPTGSPAPPAAGTPTGASVRLTAGPAIAAAVLACLF